MLNTVSKWLTVTQRSPVLDEPARHQAALTEGITAIAIAQLLRLLRQIERLLGARRGQQVEGSAISRVVIVDCLALGALLERIEVTEQLTPRLDAKFAQSLGRQQIGDLKILAGRIAAEKERLMSAAKIGGGLAVRGRGAGVADLGRQHDRGRQVALRPEHARDHRTAVRLRIVFAEIVAGHHPALAVLVRRAAVVVQTADQRHLVHHPRHQRKVLANLHTVHVRFGRPERAADIFGGVWLHVPSVEVAR